MYIKRMITFKIGIIGTGAIAHTIADTIAKIDAFEIYAVASRDLEKASAFAKEFNVTKSYGSYEELANDPNVELVYIATPHSHHSEQAKMCINAGKPVLVEKAFSYNAATAKEVIDLARSKNVYCGEAMWLRYMPIMSLLQDMIAHGVIGTVTNITANIGYNLRQKERLTSLELAGGALLDLGIYPLTFIIMIMGDKPVSIGASCTKLESGVDAQNSISLHFNGGRVGSAFSTMMYETDRKGMIYGTNGYIEVNNINCPTNIKIYRGNHELTDEVNVPKTHISGYEYEFLSARKSIILGELESPELPHSETLAMMSIMDSLRKSWKIEYPMELQ